jgi:hypothetical protein
MPVAVAHTAMPGALEMPVLAAARQAIPEVLAVPSARQAMLVVLALPVARQVRAVHSSRRVVGLVDALESLQRQWLSERSSQLHHLASCHRASGHLVQLLVARAFAQLVEHQRSLCRWFGHILEGAAMRPVRA